MRQFHLRKNRETFEYILRVDLQDTATADRFVGDQIGDIEIAEITTLPSFTTL